MKALLIIGIILGVLVLIGMIPVGVMFRYHGDTELKLVLAFLRLKILPKKPKTRKQIEKEKAKKAKKEAKKAAKKKKKQAQSLIAKPPAPPKPKEPITDKISGLLPWAKLGVSFVGEFFHKRLCIRRLNVRVAMAGGDPAKLAENNGKAWAVIGAMIPLLEQAFKIKERHVVVYPDFVGDKTDAEADIYVRLRLGGVVLKLFRYAFRAIKVLIASKKAKKEKKAQRAAEDADAAPEKQLPAGTESKKETKKRLEKAV